MESPLLKEVPAQKFTEQFQGLREEITERVGKVFASGHFILGPEVKQFQNDFARWLGAGHGIGVASGSDALLLALMALGIGPGDEVITTPFTYFATGESIFRTGAKPIFVDIDPETYNIDPRKVEERINPRTKMILPVHLYGQPCRMDRLLNLAAKHKLKVVEDCAQAHGSKFKGRTIGTFGDFGCFSFYPTKNLGGYGDGGFVAASDEALANEVFLLRGHGAVKKYHHEKMGINSRLDEVQAAILNVKLKYLDRWLSMRRERAHRYNELLKQAGVTQLRVPYEDPDGLHTYHLYTIRVDNGDSRNERPSSRRSASSPSQGARGSRNSGSSALSARDGLLDYLVRNGISAGVYYPTPLHLEKPFAYLGGRKGDCPEAEKAALDTLALPLYPELTDEDQDYVVTRIKEFYP